MGAKSLCVRYNQIDELIKIHDWIRYLVLFDYGWFDKICDRIKYLISEKNGITIVLTIILEKWELIHMIIYLFKKYWLFIML